MDPRQGRESNLYFISWIENIHHCLAHQLSYYHAGNASESLKVRLGAKLIPATILFKHRNPFIQSLLSPLTAHLSYGSEVHLPPVQLGKYWSQIPEEGKTIEVSAMLVRKPEQAVS
jgi:hypothetical protein